MSSASSKRDQQVPILLSAEVEALFGVFREHSPMPRAVQGETRAPGTTATSSLPQSVVQQIEEAISNEDEAEAWLLAAPLPLEAGEPSHFGRRRPASTPPGVEEEPDTARSLREIAAEAVAQSKRRGAPGPFLSSPLKASPILPPSPASAGNPVRLGGESPAPAARGIRGAEPTALVQRPGEQIAARTRRAWLLLGGALAVAAAFAVWRPPAVPIPSGVGRAVLPEGASGRTAETLPHTVAVGPEGRSVHAPPLQVKAGHLSSEPRPPTSETEVTRGLGSARPAPPKRGRTERNKVTAGRPERTSELATGERKRDGTAEKVKPEMVPAADIGSAAGTNRRPARPSIGAVQGALGAVLGKAKYCVIGHTQPSRATIVFNSSGQVSRVTVKGPAAGLPEGSCIVEALQRARVQPFSDAEFSVRTTVRP